MRRIKKNIIKLAVAILLLLVYSSIRFLVLPKFADYEFFSYTFFGGLLVYSISYIGITVLELVIKSIREKLIGYLLFFLLLEGSLYYFSGSCLVVSIIELKNILTCTIYHLIPFLIYIIGDWYFFKDSS